MTITDLDTAVEKAVVAQAQVILGRLGERSEPVVIGFQTQGTPQWAGPDELALAGRRVRFTPCPSVLAVLDALAEERNRDEDLVLLTDKTIDELGDAIASRLHNYDLYPVSRDRLLNDVLQPKQVDVRIRKEAWLADALIELAQIGETSSLHGTRLTLEVAIGHIVRERLRPLDPDDLDLVRVVENADDTTWRERWRALPAAHRDGLIGWFGERLGEPAGLVLQLANDRDDVLADLLVADVLTGEHTSDPGLAALFGGFASSRWGTPWPAADKIRVAAETAVKLVQSTDNERVSQQLRRADAMLAGLGAERHAYRSSVLHSGFQQRLLRAARTLTEADLDALRSHRAYTEQAALVRRVEAAVRVHRWLDTTPAEPDSVRGWLITYARDLSFMDRELVQLRKGAPQPEVASVFDRLTRAATDRRRQLDLSFAKALPAAASATPDALLAVETLLPAVAAPLAAVSKVLLLVVDGMSMPVAIDLAESIVDDGRSGWTEVVRPTDGGREPVLAAFPTVTEYSRTSLLTAKLRAGDAAAERVAFPTHRFWPSKAKALLTHKDGLAGHDGADLGPELADALDPASEKQVVAVVLNTVDDSLPLAGRQADDPTWYHRHVPGLPELLERAALSGWVVVLTSDHGHVLDHGGTHRADSTGGARWRPPGERAPDEDEILLRGPRVLTPDHEAILAVTDDLRYRRKAHGYHGGASLAEVTIPLIVLLPPGVIGLDGWTFHSLGAPDWWTGRQRPALLQVSAPKPKPRKRTEPAPQAALFAETPDRGRRLVASATFKALHEGFPRNRVLGADVVACIVDLLAEAGGRAPVADVLRAAGSAGRNPRALVSAMQKLLNVDQFPVIELADHDRTVVLNQKLLDEQFPDEGAR